jgi:hypothetical protein
MFVKYIYDSNENGSQGNERGFFSKQTEAQKPISFYAHIS